MQPALFLGTVKVGSGTDKYGSVIGASPVVGVGLMHRRYLPHFQPCRPYYMACQSTLISAKKTTSIELLLSELLKRGHLVKLTPARNATVTAPEAVGSSASTPHGCGANATERA